MASLDQLVHHLNLLEMNVIRAGVAPGQREGLSSFLTYADAYNSIAHRQYHDQSTAFEHEVVIRHPWFLPR